MRRKLPFFYTGVFAGAVDGAVEPTTSVSKDAVGRFSQPIRDVNQAYISVGGGNDTQQQLMLNKAMPLPKARTLPPLMPPGADAGGRKMRRASSGAFSLFFLWTFVFIFRLDLFHIGISYIGTPFL